jgi:hypothetical protein
LDKGVFRLGLEKLNVSWRDKFEIEHLRKDTAPPPVLYHYTGVSTLQKILQSKHLWATEGHFQNDTTELRWPAHLVDECLKDAQLLLLSVIHWTGWFR